MLLVQSKRFLRPRNPVGPPKRIQPAGVVSGHWLGALIYDTQKSRVVARAVNGLQSPVFDCLTQNVAKFQMTQSVRCPDDPTGEMPDDGA
jgi:hypothetical protein